MRHMHRREPRGFGFSWGRVANDDAGVVTYRLFRRDNRRAVHYSILTFTRDDSRSYIAKVLHRARRQLRDQVDEIDLVAMGVSA